MIYDYYEDPYHNDGEEDKGSGKVLLLFFSALIFFVTGVGFGLYSLVQFLR